MCRRPLIRDLGVEPAHASRSRSPLARTFAPPAWGWLADASGAHRAIVVFSCAVIAVSFAALPFTERSRW